MKILFIFALFCVIYNASRFYTENSLSPIEMQIPFDVKGKGRLKAQVRNFNPRKTAKYFAKSLAESLFIIPAFLIIPAQIGNRIHFPILSGKTQVPVGDGWEKVNSKRGKYSFEYHHRNINRHFNEGDSLLFGRDLLYERHNYL